MPEPIVTAPNTHGSAQIARPFPPLVSVIVPTYNRASVLPYLFAALAGQVYPASRLELIVVDNSSSDDTEAVVRRWSGVLPFPVSFFRKANNGPAASRNYGAARSHGEIIAFTDSDCVPAPHWVQSAVRGFAEGAGLVCGPLVPKQRPGDPTLFFSQVPMLTDDRGLYPTANLFVRRAAFHAAGGFDERLALYPWGGLVGGEDTDLAWRLRRKREPAIFSPAVRVGHLATPLSVRQWVLRPFILFSLPLLLRSIPELRQTLLWRGYFLTRIHFLFNVAWLGAVAALITGSPLPLVAVLPWLYDARVVFLYDFRRGALVRGASVLALTIVQFLMTTVVLVAGSIRYRRAVL